MKYLRFINVNYWKMKLLHLWCIQNKQDNVL